VAVSLPIAAYVLTLGLASPFAGRLATTLGERRLLLVGFAIAAVSHLGMVFADAVWQITLLRGLTGVGYAVATVASLEYLIERQPSAERMRAMTTFVLIVIGGTFAGTALGGILADRLGYRPVFAVSVGLVVIAALLAWRLLSGQRERHSTDTGVFAWRDVSTVLRRPRPMALLAGVTVPMNVVLAAFLWYLVPLSLAAAGESTSAIGRTLMLYYLAVLVAGRVVARLGANRVSLPMLVGLGALVSGSALLIPASGISPLSVSMAVVIVGLGHAAIRGPQLSLAIELGEDMASTIGRGATLAAMRMLERLGSLVGLLLAAVVVARADMAAAMVALAISASLAAMAYLGYSFRAARRAEHA
jgi:predicted MFS family arabinose efflux permease